MTEEEQKIVLDAITEAETARSFCFVVSERENKGDDLFLKIAEMENVKIDTLLSLARKLGIPAADIGQAQINGILTGNDCGALEYAKKGPADDGCPACGAPLIRKVCPDGKVYICCKNGECPYLVPETGGWDCDEIDMDSETEYQICDRSKK